MSAKLIHENTDLKKQIGCMNGVFQLFHRHRFIAKRLHGHSNNSLHSDDKCANQAAESRSKVQKATQKGTNKVVKEKPTSTESSRTSFSSSSCSSSFSSTDYARTVPIELYLSSQTIPDLPTKRQTSTIQSSQLPCFDFGDIIRNSMHRDVRGVALKTTTRDEAVVRTLKYIDSPRPSQLLKSLKHHNDSFQVFDNTNEQRDVCMHSSPKEIRRLSYDERDTLKSNINLKEIPRLSLDSKANYSNDLQQEPESFKRSSSSVIVKLMGIEAFPDSTDSTSTNECQSKSWRGSETLGSKSSPSVYGEIEKILAELEFKKSGKDLIALKQNFESMQKTKGMLESQMSNNNSFDCNPSRTYRSPIIIMKSAKLNGKNTDPGSDVSSFDNSTSPCKLRLSDSTFNKKGLVEKRTAKHPTKNNESTDNCHSSSTDKNAHKRTSKSVQTSKTSRNNSEGKGNKRGSGTASSKLQCKQFGLDNKESHQVSSSSESSRSRKHGTKQPIDSSSSTRKCMLGSPNLQRRKDKVNETKTSIRHLSHHGNALSIHYESTTSFNSHPEGEIIFKTFGKNQRDVAAGLCVAEQGTASTEQPSPVSVLDTTFYRDDSPSPVKKISFDLEDEETLYPDEVKWQSMELAQLSSKIDTKTLEDTMKNLVQNPQLESFSKPDHKYISDILSASALNLDSGLTNIQLQNLNYVINPKMFFTLEKVKALDDENASEKTPQMKYNQVIHRKLVFDVVNEIVSQKLVVPYSFKRCLVPQPRGQNLLRKLCSVVDRLQDHDYGSLVDEDDNMRNILPEDLMDWLGCESEIPRMVLDIERLIYKDLITQVVSGMTTCCKIDIAGNLFSK